MKTAAYAIKAAPLAFALTLAWARGAQAQPKPPAPALACEVQRGAGGTPALTCAIAAGQADAIRAGGFSATVKSAACQKATLSIVAGGNGAKKVGSYQCTDGAGPEGAIAFRGCQYAPDEAGAKVLGLQSASYKCETPAGQVPASSTFDLKLPDAPAPTPPTPKAPTAGDAYELTRGVRDSVVFHSFGLDPKKSPDQGAQADRVRAAYYDRSGDAAVLFFNTSGEPLAPLPDVLDENDDIHVAVIDFADKFDNFSLSLEGCERVPVLPRVYRGGDPAAYQATSADALKLGGIYRSFGKCAGGGDAPRLVFRKGRGATATTSSFAIHVNPLYRFAVGVALGFDATQVRSFDLRRAPGDTVGRVVETKDALGLSSLVYVSLYLSPRDFRKRDTLLWERTQLFVGLDPRDLGEHLVVGAGYELAVGLNALVGWRVLTRQRVLAEGSGLRPGDTFDGAEPPTRERWEVGGPFVGVGLSTDLLNRLR
jgi:hypothetical protein